MMKKITLNFAFCLLTLLSILSGCSKKDVAPQQPGNATQANDATITSYMVKGYLFVRMPGPFGLGHTGVGYEVREMSGSTVLRTYTRFGGVEGFNNAPYISAGSNNGGWSGVGYTNNVSMLNTMRSPYGYTAYKFETAFRTVTSTQLQNAANNINRFPLRGYNVSGNNCMNAAYDVLKALNAPGLAWPSTNWYPKDQYANTVTGWSGSRAL